MISVEMECRRDAHHAERAVEQKIEALGLALIFLVLALLCGFGGGNFASSMANISYFFPKSEKDNALAINAGLGNVGVSLMQFLVPIVITAGIFGALGSAPQRVAGGAELWMQNAGFVWVPLIIAGTLAAWFGMRPRAAPPESASGIDVANRCLERRPYRWCCVRRGSAHE